ADEQGKHKSPGQILLSASALPYIFVNRSPLPPCFRHISCSHVFPSPYRMRERNSICCFGGRRTTVLLHVGT
ncbi:hypothetical protein ACWLOJ_005154, partial [Escherichia coli]